MSYSQNHGKTWEKSILSEVYHLTENEFEKIGYTDVHDLPAHLNTVDHVNVSIKTSGSKKTICLGCPVNIFETLESSVPFHMFVILYRQNGGVKRLHEIVKLDLTGQKSLLFGRVTLDDIKELKRVIHSVPSGRRTTPEEHKSIHDLKTKLNTLANGPLIFNPKLDSKNQRRLQCSFNSFPKFIEEHPELVLPINIETVRILKEIQSEKRVRSKQS